MQMKLNILHYIMMQNEESLAHQILFRKGFPGFTQECMTFIKDLNILNPFQHWLSEHGEEGYQ